MSIFDYEKFEDESSDSRVSVDPPDTAMKDKFDVFQWANYPTKKLFDDLRLSITASDFIIKRIEESPYTETYYRIQELSHWLRRLVNDSFEATCYIECIGLETDLVEWAYTQVDWIAIATRFVLEPNILNPSTTVESSDSLGANAATTETTEEEK